MKNSLLISIIVFSVTSCSNRSLSVGEYGYYPPVGSHIVLNQDLTIAADTAGLYIQGGHIMGGSHNRFEAFCYIRFYNVSQSTRTIHPDIFLVGSSKTELRLIADRKIKLSIRKVSYQLTDNSPSDIVAVVSMRIHSHKQPGVYLLECGGVEDIPSEVEPPSIADIRHAMGRVMTLKLP